MNIVIFGPAYPFRGGIAQFSGVLCGALTQAGHKVTLVNFRKQFPKFLFPGATQFDDSPDALKVESIRAFTLWNPLSWFSAACAIRNAKPDLILFAWWMPLFGGGYWAVARLIGGKYRRRLAFLLHNVIPHERRIGDVFFSKLALGAAAGYVALSRAEEQQMRTQFPRVPAHRIRYSPHPIYDCYEKFMGRQDDARRELGLTAKKIIMFFGFVREYKGLDILVKAMPQILARDPEIQLAVVGEFYQDKRIYTQLIDALGIQENVIIRDNFVGGKEVGKWFAAADVVVLPYRSATQSGIIPIAYALGAPVITTDVGGLGEVVENGVTGFVVPPEDPEAIAGAVEKFYALGGRSHFNEKVIQEAQKFSWEAMVKELEKLAEDLK